MAADLHAEQQSLRSGPSDALARMFSTCSEGLSEQVQTSLEHRLQRVMDSSRSTADELQQVRLQRCCFESKRWYYKILEDILQEESQKPGFKTVSMQNFLENRQCQDSLLLLCLEISSFNNTMAFNLDPSLLQTLRLLPYQFWKVFSVVFHWLIYRDELALSVTDHLVKVDEMIFDRLVWSSDSPIWEEIRANEGKMPECPQVMPPEELKDPMRGERCDISLLLEDAPSDQQNSTSERPKRSSHLYRFARKIYRLMHMRLTTLCSSLNLPEDVQRKIWTCFEFSVVHHFDLLQDRQLHWLLLCAVYALIKDIRKLPFRLIINLYRSKQVSKRVPMLTQRTEEPLPDDYPRASFPTPTSPSEQDEEEDALSCFYSQVYLPSMGHFVRKFTPAPGTETPPLSPYPTPPSAPPRKMRWRPEFNIYVSPMQEAAPHPRPTGLSYVTQSSPSQRLHDINALVRSHRSPARRELSFDRDEEAGPSAKMSWEGCLERRLQAMKDDQQQSREGAGLSSKHLYI